MKWSTYLRNWIYLQKKGQARDCKKQLQKLPDTVSVRFLERRFKFSFVSISPRANLKFFSIFRHGTCQIKCLVLFGPICGRGHSGQNKEKEQKWTQHFSSSKYGPLPNISNWIDKRTLRDTGWKWIVFGGSAVLKQISTISYNSN